MAPNHICILSTVHSISDVRIVKKQALTLAKAGFRVTVIALEETDQSETADVRVISLPRPRNRLHRVVRILSTLRLALCQRASIYAFHDPELLPAGVLLKLFANCKVVYDVHEDVPISIHNKKWLAAPFRPFVAQMYSLLERIALRYIDGLTLADYSYQKYYSGKNTLTILNYPLSNYAHLYQESPPSKRRRPVLIYCGSITALRGLYEMLGLIHRFKSSRPDLLLRLVGPFGSKAEYDQAWKLIAHYGVEGNVEILGMVSHLEVHNHILNADIGLVLLHPDPNYINSLPTKMFEYMIMGKPVVVSDFPLWREIVQDTGCGFLVDPLDPEPVEKAVVQLLENHSLRQEMGDRGREAVLRRYNWDSQGRKLVKFYQELQKHD